MMVTRQLYPFSPMPNECFFDQVNRLRLVENNPAKTTDHVKRVKQPVDFLIKEEFKKVISQIYVDNLYKNLLIISI